MPRAKTKTAKKNPKKRATKKKAAKKKASGRKKRKVAKKKSTKKKSTKKKSTKKKSTKKKAKASGKKRKKVAKKKSTAKKTPKKAGKKKAGKKKAGKKKAGKKKAGKKKAGKKKPASASNGALQPGSPAPAFSLESDDGGHYSRDSLLGQRYVIYFYPRDNTSGCTREACDFRDRLPEFAKAGVKVLGVSSDNLQSHSNFRDKYSLPFPLLSDPGNKVATAFGAMGEKSLYGRSFYGLIRSTFVVGPDGKIEKTFSPVRVDGHVQAVLQASN